MTKIHPSAIVEKGAELDSDVEVGAYAYIGGSAKIGSGTVVAHHATVDGNTVLGKCNQIFPYAFIGGKTHDLKYKGGLENRGQQCFPRIYDGALLHGG